MICLTAHASRGHAPGTIAAGLVLLGVLLGTPYCGRAETFTYQSRVGRMRSSGAAQVIPLDLSGPANRFMAEDDTDSAEAEVAPGDIEKFVSVYKAMQRDRGLTVDQAATRQGLTLQSFRDLESRIERDDAALQRARDELQAAAQASPAAQPTSVTPAP